MNRIVPFEPEHIDLIDTVGLGICPSYKKLGRLYKDSGPAFSAFVDDKLIACGGLAKLWDGVYQAWTVTTPQIMKHKKFFHGSVLEYLDMIMNDLKPRRVQATVWHKFWRGQKWLERLGFVREGLMKKYDAQGLDCWLYAKVT